MPEEEEDQTLPRRRSTDNTIIETVQRVDAGVSVMWRWGTIVTIVIGFAFTIGVEWTKAKDTQDAFDRRATSIENSFKDFKDEIRGRLERTGTDAAAAKDEVHDLKLKQEEERRDIDRLRKDVDENLKIMMAIKRHE